MAKFMMAGTKGPTDPNAATFAFVAANEAVAQGHEVEVSLRDDAVLILKDGVADTIRGVGMPPFKDAFDAAVKKGIPIAV